MTDTKPFHVVHVLAAGRFGGLESVVQSLTRGQVERGHRVDVVLMLDRASDAEAVAGRLEAGGATVHGLVRGRGGLVAERMALRRRLCGLAPDLVHTHGYRADIQAGSSARRLRCPIVSTLHGFTGGSLKVRLFEVVQLVSLRRHDRCIAVSHSVATRLRRAGLGADHIRVVQNAWATQSLRVSRDEARRALGLPVGHGPVIGWVGRFSPEKAPDVALEALRDVARVGAVLCFVGDGPSRHRLEGLAAAYGLVERVHFAGAHVDASRLFEAFDVLVSSSHTEGTPIVLFEAMDAGVPIVATRVGGVPEMLDETCAWLVEPAAPIELARALDAVLEDRHAAAQRAALARRRLAERFSLDAWLDAHDRLYRELVA